MSSLKCRVKVLATIILGLCGPIPMSGGDPTSLCMEEVDGIHFTACRVCKHIV